MISHVCATPKQDSLLHILQITDPDLKEKKLVLNIRYYFNDVPVKKLETTKSELLNILQTHHVQNQEALEYFVETMYQMGIKRYKEAEKTLTKATELAHKNKAHYLLYACFTHMAFLQTIKGNTIEAISNFRLARKEALTLNDAYIQAMVDINISDIYYKNNLYSQSLLYLQEAQGIVDQKKFADNILQVMIWSNKAENYFCLGKADSVALYSKLLNNAPNTSGRLYTIHKRMAYYLALLQQNYQQAVALIRAAKDDPKFVFEAYDELNLADAYFKAGKLDSARNVALQVLAGREYQNHPEIQVRLYEILGGVALNRSDKDEAVLQYQLALGQAKKQIERLTQVGIISSQIKVDEIEGAYIRKEESFKRTRLWLVFTAISAILIIGIGTMLYRNIRQKRHYEQLFFKFKKDELAFINSHEVRRHLSNILGIVTVIENSDNKEDAFHESRNHLVNAAVQLDDAIKNISAKLDEPSAGN
ncbi:tetratricopeptide repeat protein [Mucilaginibacter sp. 14171R-50]|uniref:tetratricopeptide repeat protein n=1 Tax=Mucilaginibacter sp. 14171R-50 TaxID=2703789 RepID=UPI00138B6AB0|nr:tetratricopeptide repeat protein [Mucilaginibacter sp. 14171R-50]QHS56877.1 tetratricopeptide repeat protein [Mucilaginibacter sp. 14171R-50]